MRGILIRWVILAGMLYALSMGVEGIHVEGAAPFLVILALALLNALARPFLFLVKVATFPLNLITLGLFALALSFVVNVLIFAAVGMTGLVTGFKVETFEAAFIGAFVLAITNSVATSLVRDKDDKDKR